MLRFSVDRDPVRAALWRFDPHQTVMEDDEPPDRPDSRSVVDSWGGDGVAWRVWPFADVSDAAFCPAVSGDLLPRDHDGDDADDLRPDEQR